MLKKISISALLLPALSAALTAAVVITVTASDPETPENTVSGVDLDNGVESVAYRQAVAAAKARKPKVTVIGTGGTIAGVATSRSSFTDYRAGQIPIADMVGQLQPELGNVADVTTVQFGNKGLGRIHDRGIPSAHARRAEGAQGF